MLCGIHNHDLAGHLLAGRLKVEEKQRVIDMTKSLAKPRNILTDLKEKNKENLTLIKQVYNARTKWRKGQREDKTELQYLITKLEPISTKPIPTECRYLRLLVLPLPK